MNAIHLPSGDHCGSLSFSPRVIWRWELPSVAISHNCDVLSLVSIEYDETAVQAHRPSGDRVTGPKRRIAHRSSIVIGRFLFLVLAIDVDSEGRGTGTRPEVYRSRSDQRPGQRAAAAMPTRGGTASCGPDTSTIASARRCARQP